MDLKTKESRIELFGLQFDRLSLKEAVEKIDSYIKSGQPRQIVVVNAAKIVKARYDWELLQILQSADLVGPDGVPLVWVSKLLGKPLPGRVNGTDLMEKLIPFAADRKYSIYFFGAKEEIIKKTVSLYSQLYPNLRIAGYRNGYFSDAEEEDIVNEIKNSGADILLVGMGTPQKEKWIKRNLLKLNVPVVHGVGGSFDVVAGYVNRAPLWMQKWGLEWLYRLCQEPGRMWKRYLVTNSIFCLLVFKEMIRTIFSRKPTIR